MANKKSIKCIVRNKDYKAYLSGTATYQGELYHAKIFNYNTMPDYLKNSSDDEVIFLDSGEGLEILLKEFEMLDSQIPEMKRKLNEMKKGREKLYKTNPELINNMINRYNRNYSHDSETKRNIVKQILKNK